MKIKLNAESHFKVKTLYVMQSDSGRELEVEFLDIPKEKISAVKIFVKKPSRKTVFSSGTFNGETAKIQIHSQMISELGEAQAVITTADASGKLISTYPIIFRVVDSPIASDAVPSENKLISKEFEDLINQTVSNLTADFETQKQNWQSTIDDLNTKVNDINLVSFTEEELTILRNAGIEV